MLRAFDWIEKKPNQQNRIDDKKETTTLVCKVESKTLRNCTNFENDDSKNSKTGSSEFMVEKFLTTNCPVLAIFQPLTPVIIV